MKDISQFDTRRLQIEAARVLAAGDGFGNDDLLRFNKQSHHDSHQWYRAVISWYLDQYGGLPSEVGPGRDVKLLLE